MTPETIPEPEKKSHSQMDSVTNHAIHRKPGTFVPSQDEFQDNHIDDLMTPTRYEAKTTQKSVNKSGLFVRFLCL